MVTTVSEVMQRDFLELDAQTTITQAVGKMQQFNERYAVIFDKRFKPSYRGILDRTSLIESKLDANAEIGTFAMHPPVVSSDTSVYKAAELLYHSYPSLLPVQKKDKIIGVVRANDIFSLLLKMPTLARMKAMDIATTDIVKFPYETRLGDVLNRMREMKFSHAPIIDKAGRIIGIFSLTDLFEKHFLRPEGKLKGSGRDKRGFEPKGFAPVRTSVIDTNIGDAASTTVITVSPTATLGVAIKEMYEHEISDVVVAQDRRPVGMITARDLLKVFAETEAPEYWGIQFFGCEQLIPQQYDSVRKQMAELYEKTKRAYFKNIIYFLVHIKKYEQKEHGRAKYSVHLRLAIPARVFNAEQAHFDLNTAVSWALKALESEVLRFKEKGKKPWTITGKHGKRQELGKAERRALDERGKVIRPKRVKRE